jgi:hypothetical protein
LETVVDTGSAAITRVLVGALGARIATGRPRRLEAIVGAGTGTVTLVLIGALGARITAIGRAGFVIG